MSYATLGATLEAVIFLAHRQISKCTDKQSETFFFRWCMCIFVSCVFLLARRPQMRGFADHRDIFGMYVA